MERMESQDGKPRLLTFLPVLLSFQKLKPFSSLPVRKEPNREEVA